MNLYENALSFMSAFICLVLLTLVLRARGVLSKADAPLVARLTIDLVLPAIIVSKLIFVRLDRHIFLVSLYIILAELLVGVVAYAVGRFVLRLPRPSLGVFVLCSTFGSTAILGTAFISAVFDGEQTAIAYALVISQIASGIPAYVAMPIIAMHFGEHGHNQEPVLARLKRIVMTPTVLAILFGLSWSALELPTHGLIITPLLGAANYISLALVLMVALLNGLSLDRIPIRQNAMTVLCCAVLLLLVEPLLVYAIDDLGDAARRERQLSFILSAMPSSNSTIAFAIRYGCDARLAATLVTTTAILSAISLPTLMASFHLFNQ